MKRTIELKMRFVANWTLRHHHSDLKVDFDFIRTYAPDRFIWITSECGTHFYRFWKNEELPRAGQRVPYLFGTATRERIVDKELETLRDCFQEWPCWRNILENCMRSGKQKRGLLYES